MSHPGYPYMDGVQQMYKPDANESNRPMPDVSIQHDTDTYSSVESSQQGLRDALRATQPMPADPDSISG